MKPLRVERLQTVEKILPKRKMIFASFWYKRKRGVGQSPTTRGESRVTRRRAPNNAKKALKGFGGKQEFSPGLFLPKAGKEIL